jgi:hypothetical protein
MDDLSPQELKAEILNHLKQNLSGVTTNRLIELLPTESDDRIKSTVRSLSKQNIIYSETVVPPWAVWKLTENKPLKVLCIHCKEPVETTTIAGRGTVWIHEDGFMECRATYASPNLIEYEHNKKEKESQ